MKEKEYTTVYIRGKRHLFTKFEMERALKRSGD